MAQIPVFRLKQFSYLRDMRISKMCTAHISQKESSWIPLYNVNTPKYRFQIKYLIILKTQYFICNSKQSREFLQFVVHLCRFLIPL